MTFKRTVLKIQQLLIDAGAKIKLTVVDASKLESNTKVVDICILNEAEFVAGNEELSKDLTCSPDGAKYFKKLKTFKILNSILLTTFKLNGGSELEGYPDPGAVVLIGIDMIDGQPVISIERAEHEQQDEQKKMATSFKSFLTEARKDGVKFKEEKTKGQVDKVIALLEGHDAAQLTKLARQFHTLSKAIKKMGEKRDSLNAQLKDLVGVTFDPEEDKFLTRVMASASWTATLAKETRPEDVSEKVEIEYERLVDGLKAMLDETLLPAADKLVEACTKKWKPEPRSPNLTVKPLDEGVLDTLAGWWRAAKLALANYLHKFDKELPKLQAQLARYKAMPKPKVVKESVDWRNLGAEEMYDYANKVLSEDDIDKLNDELQGLHVEDEADHEEAIEIMTGFLNKTLD